MTATTAGTGFYPEFHALWHLRDLGVLSDPSDGASPHWARAADRAPVRIVVMDTTVDWGHPNLAGVIDLAGTRDFSSADSADLLVTQDADGDVTALSTAPTIYGAHGTAVAGLIGARPARVRLQQPDRIGLGALPPDRDTVILPYAGINPFCRIIPVSLTAAPDPDMVCAALDHVIGLKAQIVVVAAAWDDTNRATANEKSFDKAARAWTDVEDRLRALGRQSLVLCAAGNSGPGALAYPASLAGTIPGLIAVTACDARGAPLSYAYDPAGAAAMIATLSTEGTRHDRDKVLLDPWASVDPLLKRPAGNADYPAQRIISLDPRGPRGYNPSVYRYTPPTGGPHLEIASLYAAFSGTSAATAIAAGLIGLAMQGAGVTDPTTLKTGMIAGNGRLFDMKAALDLL